MTQDKKKMTTTTKGQDMEQFCMQKVRAMLSLSFLLLMLCLGVNGAWGQSTDYSGTYFIANGNGYSSTNIANNFYLVPATNSNYATDQPHLTTTKSGQVLNCCWQIVKSGDYYRIIHVADGKYLTANPAYSGTSGNDVGRLRVHLEEMATPDDNTLFEIKVNSNGGYNIRHKDMADKINNSTTTYLDPAGGNVNGTNLTNARTATTSSGKINVGGGIGYWTDEAAARWRFEEVPQNNTYTYNIVDCSGRIAIKYTTGADQPAAKALSSYTDIPEAIRSPYLNGETVKFYTFSDSYSTPAELLGLLTDENKITATPVTDGANIYVTYTTDHLADRFVKLHGASAFNITVNSKCIYDDSGLTVETTDFSSTTTTKNHLWYFDGDDPYAVEIKNLDTGNLLQFDTTGPTLSVATAPTNKYFIIMDGSTSGAGIANGQMELMAATGDAMYYRIANAEALNIDNSTTTGDASLQVRAYPVSISTKYHLIDKAGKLIEGNIESESSELALPSEWQSPLVSEYHYYRTSGLSGDTYSPSGTITSPFDVGSGGDIYVTYDVGDAIDLDGRNSLNISGKENKTYMLRYLNGDSFYQENGGDDVMDGSDGKTAELRKAVYPYSNGDAALYVYGDKRWQEQLASGASTRSRWLWLIEPANSPATKNDLDPYHVYISSNQTQTNYKPADVVLNYYHSYFRTYQPDGYDKIVTGVTNDNPKTTGRAEGDPANNSMATEYMILGTLSNSRLVTLHPVPLDSNHDGTPESNERRTITSFEMYWKNNPTVNGDQSHNPPIPGVFSTGNKVTTPGRNVTLTASQKTDIENKGWHVYEEWANSAPWVNNGDNPATIGKKYLKEEHVFQTISMGADFVFEAVTLAPQVILLDQHGWEIVRVPLSNTSKLREYNSPMVEKYYWYSDINDIYKVPGYHKYILSGEPFAETTSLSTPPSGDKDFYVTYTVKSTYANAYQGAATEDAVTATPYILKQGGNYATYSGSGTTIGTTATKPDRENITDNVQWYLKPNFNIDREMGYKYAGETGAQDGAKSKAATEQDNFDEGRNGFDPYNVQIQNRAYPLRYFTANTSGSALDGGIWKASTSSTVNMQNISTKQTAAGYDQTTLNITNATFMVVDDGNGNMRLMPRFDHGKVMQSFGTLAEQAAAGTGTQTLSLESIAEAKEIHSSDEITDMNGNYLLAEDFSFASGFTSLGTSTAPFTGVIDGQLHTINVNGTIPPLVAYANGATIKNVILKGATITSGYNNPDDENDANNGDTGAICCVATGSTKIYNCGLLPGSVLREDENDENKITGFGGSSVSGAHYVGGIVGYLGGASRVINCYSYANITGGSERAGIVGYNSYASRHADIKTMVMNCMFYGDIATGETIAPIYGGLEISNEDKVDNVERRLNNYNYFLYEAPYSKNNTTTNVIISKYNRALAAEERYLNRFEFYRYLVNSTRELAAFYVDSNPETITIDSKEHKRYNVDLMAKWVLDKSIAPYPILNQQGKYSSVVNYDPEYTNDEAGAKVLRTSISDTEENRNKGRHIGTLTVYINESNTTDGGQTKPTGASVETGELTLNRTDKDYNNFNYNYDKVQLPYYNDVGTKNYTGSKVVTGWKITGMSKSAGTFSSSTYDAPSYNFADRECTQKDIYSVSGRVFSQGAYFDVPDGVTSITIEPYWGNAAYLSDANYDCYGYGGNGVGSFGLRYNNESNYSINNDSQPVYTSIANALTRLDNLGRSTSTTVYDNAIVLVGNYHKGGDSAPSDDSKPYTIMSADLNMDNEPDYSYISYSGKNKPISPIRFDFVNAPGTAMAHKLTSTTQMGIIGNMRPNGWFEVTNTCVIRFSQLEYDYGSKKNDTPLILLGGIVEQIVSTNANNNKNEASHTNYIHVGSNVWFKLFNNGCHMDKTKVATPHRPISVTGGEYEKFYLSGYFQPNAPVADNAADKNAECYIDGGKFGEVAAASQEKIDGNVTWIIKNADIESFFGGGINEASPVTGDINVTIHNSHVGLYCGGPKFGNMTSTASKKSLVETTATSCTFGDYFGAGYGGTSLYRDIWSPGSDGGHNRYGAVNYSWETWLGDDRGYHRGQYVSGKGIAVSFETEQFEGSTTNTVARLYVNFATMSVARTNSVTSRLNECIINKNFYGGGNLGSVNGDLSSTLTNCKVYGSVFGAGCSSTSPTAVVYDLPTSENFKGVYYNSSTGVFEPTIYPPKVEYTWSDTKGGNTNTTTLVDEGSGDNAKHWIHTDVSLSGLGVVEGKVTLNIDGNTVVMGQVVNEDADGNITYGAQTGGVFGGGDASAVIGETEVVVNATALKSGYTYNVHNVYGGGNNGEVRSSTGGATGNTTVTLKGNTVVNADVFGGGNEGVVEGSAKVNIKNE